MHFHILSDFDPSPYVSLLEFLLAKPGTKWFTIVTEAPPIKKIPSPLISDLNSAPCPVIYVLLATLTRVYSIRLFRFAPVQNADISGKTS